MGDGAYVAIDFETANEKQSSACALGIAVVADAQIVERRSWLIRPPEMRFNPMNISIHGIRPIDVEDAPGFDELWPVVQDYLKDRTVIAHNAAFDMGVLTGTLRAHGLPAPNIRYSCTLAIARHVWPALPNHKLHSVANHLGIAFSHHDAADDAMAAAKIAISACDRTGSVSLTELLKNLNLRTRRLQSHRSLADQ